MKNPALYTTSHFNRKIAPWFVKNKYHFLAWTLFIANEVAAARIIGNRFAPLPNYLIHYAINISFFYLVALYVLPMTFKIKRLTLIKFAIAIFLALILYSLLVFAADQLLSLYTNYQFKTANLNIKHYFAFTTLWRGVFFLLPAIGYYYIMAYLKSRKAEEASKTQILEQMIREQQNAIALAESKNAYLKAQINPHFLFNAFTMLYSNSRKKNTPVAKAIMSLSKIMRFAVDVNQSDERIRIGQELEQVGHLIEFWELQNQQDSPIQITCAEETTNAMFIPLILLTLVENMLKHGVWEPGSPKGELSIVHDGTTLTIITQNPIHEAKPDYGFQSGISNITARLRHSYGELANLAYGIDQQNKIFELKITVST